MKRVKILAVSLMMMFGLLSAAQPAYAINIVKDQACQANPSSAICKSSGDDVGAIVKNVVNVLLYILGIISVIMIIVGGIRYTTSGGDSSGVKSAKDTILYAIIGLVVAIMAYAIVNFVLGSFK